MYVLNCPVHNLETFCTIVLNRRSFEPDVDVHTSPPIASPTATRTAGLFLLSLREQMASACAKPCDILSFCVRDSTNKVWVQTEKTGRANANQQSVIIIRRLGKLMAK